MPRSESDELENDINSLTKTIQRLEAGEYADMPGMKKRIQAMRVRVQSARDQLRAAYRGDDKESKLAQEIWGPKMTRGGNYVK